MKLVGGGHCCLHEECDHEEYKSRERCTCEAEKELAAWEDTIRDQLSDDPPNRGNIKEMVLESLDKLIDDYGHDYETEYLLDQMYHRCSICLEYTEL
jgi:hypothetical protein